MKTVITAVMLISGFHAFANDHQSDPEHYVTVGEQSPELRESAVIPKFNQTMPQVRKLLGEPATHDEVGKPVISRWYYGDKTVYFQDGRVIRTVIQGRDAHTVQSPR